MPSLSAFLNRRNVEALSGVPTDWERPGPSRRQQVNDVVIAVLVFAVGLLAWWVYNELDERKVAVWQAAVGLGVQCMLLSIRRTYPVICLLAASVAFIAISQWLPGLSVQLSFQGAYFAALYSAAAWAKDSRVFRVCAAGILVVMGLWLVIGSTLFGAYQKITEAAGDTTGPLPPFFAYMTYSVILNVAFFAGAIYFGRRARASAWQHETLAEQAEQLRVQSAELARRAVVDERLRIARELHDVVAHHISAVGIQAAAARRIQERDPKKTADLLVQMEGEARSALAETRALLGVLRSEPAPLPDAGLPTTAFDAPVGRGTESRSARTVSETPGMSPASTPPQDPASAIGPGSETTQRSPEPGLADLPDLFHALEPTLHVDFTRVDSQGLPLNEVPHHLGLTLYRVTQEALTNTRRHSTARSATVTLRTGDDETLGGWVEVEILDSGRPLPTPRGPQGSGYGLEGIRERATLHLGQVEIGPRTGTPGFRVRLRVPLARPDAAPPTAGPSTASPNTAPTPNSPTTRKAS